MFKKQIVRVWTHVTCQIKDISGVCIKFKCNVKSFFSIILILSGAQYIIHNVLNIVKKLNI